MRILFVCTGNTCRSPMAEKLFKKIAADKGIKAEAKSAGLFASAGSAASGHAAAILERKGITEKHMSQTVTDELLDWADLIITMTQSHKNTLLQQFPDCQEKVYTLKEYADTSEETGERLGKLDALYDRLEAKQQAFMDEHREEIRALEDEYQKLYTRLESVREKLDDWRDRIMQATLEERNEIAILERQTPDYDVADPFGADLTTYEECAKEIEEALIRLVTIIERDAKFSS
ncbi:low molecular weight protein arginine phosphatase [Aneurinibacillus sp. REN35]|uniref:low molecular weight protein arginine phosphatase n=1 Tax=Aneurinibacillus sp. REN35 TaxID=3237286 RepID=UPI003526E037